MYVSFITVTPWEVVVISILKGDNSTLLKPSTTESSDNPAAKPTAAEASAFEIICSPAIFSSTLALPQGVFSKNDGFKFSSNFVEVARISPRSPKVSFLARVLGDCRVTCSTSALSTAHPSMGSRSNISPFVLDIESIEPNTSVCDSATVVMTPISGYAISQSSAISPSLRAPISNTKNSESSGVFRSVKGTPISLL